MVDKMKCNCGEILEKENAVLLTIDGQNINEPIETYICKQCKMFTSNI